jgi:hypothetical protein
MKAAEGSFVVPAANADKALALRKKYLADGGGVKKMNEVDDSRDIQRFQGTEEEKEAARKSEPAEKEGSQGFRDLTRHDSQADQFTGKTPVKKAGAKVGDGPEVPVKVSNGEHIFTPEEVAILKSKGVNLNALAPNADTKLSKAEGGVLPDNQTQNAAGVTEKPNEDGIKDVGLKKGGGIHINPANKGKFNATKKATGKTTAELTHSSNPVTKKRAIFAQNSSHWQKKDEGGLIGQLNAMLKGGKVQKKADGGNIIDSRQKQVISSPQEADVEQKVNSKIVLPTSNQPVTKKKFVNTQTNIGGAIPNFTVSGQDALKKGGLIHKLMSGGVIQTVTKGPDDTALLKTSTGNVKYNANGGKIAPDEYVKNWGTGTNHGYLKKGGKVGGYDGDEGSWVNPNGPSTVDPTANPTTDYSQGDPTRDPSTIVSNMANPVNPTTLTPRMDQDSQTSNPAAKPQPNWWQKNQGNVLAGGQAAAGLAYTLAQKRPTYTIPPEVQQAYASAQQQATYGLDPASKAAINNAIASRSATNARTITGVAGGSAANAFRMIQGANAAGGNSLIQMYAQDAAAKRAKQGQVYGLAQTLGNYRNFAYQQDMNKFLQNQQAGANLLGSGIQNLYTLSQGQKAQQNIIDRQNKYNPQTGQLNPYYGT